MSDDVDVTLVRLHESTEEFSIYSFTMYLSARMYVCPGRCGNYIFCPFCLCLDWDKRPHFSHQKATWKCYCFLFFLFNTKYELTILIILAFKCTSLNVLFVLLFDFMRYSTSTTSLVPMIMIYIMAGCTSIHYKKVSQNSKFTGVLTLLCWLTVMWRKKGKIILFHLVKWRWQKDANECFLMKRSRNSIQYGNIVCYIWK